ncbi:MAG: ABC-F family ATP-binding cassette domain-containing protein [Saprospirales bacterium]|nr:ABC-F family ATP-binding cassette domain-containing protein [Saprospirales bacterium]
MITATNLYIQYGNRVLMDDISLVITDKDRVGLVGRNGAGKSTLLKLLAGVQRPDNGTISRPADSTLGFLHQDMVLPRGRTVLEEALTAFSAVLAMEKRLEELHEIIATRTDYESPAYLNILEEFALLNDQFELMGGAAMEANAEKVLKGLGFKQSDFSRQTTEFSGGWQMRVELTKMLLQKPDYLFLDEPTNHLDIESILWLESFLKDYPGAIVVISHDRTFLDKVTTRTIEIESGNLYDYKAAYSKYVELRAERREKLQSAFDNQQRVIAEKERTINRFMAKATKTKMAQSMQKQLDKLERIELDDVDISSMNIRFLPAPRSGQVVLETKGLAKEYGNLTVFKGVDLHMDRGDRIAFVGQNGQGKTTLARILVQNLSATHGKVEWGHNVQIGYYAQNQSESLSGNLTVLQTMEQASPAEMRPKLRGLLGAFLFSGEDVEKKVSVLSGGERARLALASLLLKPMNLLLLDEPTNHLDMISKEVLKEALLKFDGTLIVVSHDRDFLAGLTNKTIEFRDHELKEYLGDVNFFLEKRALDNMREVEKRSATSAAQASASLPRKELSYEDRKKLTRAVAQAEKKVEKLEAAIADFEAIMASPEFYARPDAQEQLKAYEDAKEALEIAFEEWELAEKELGDS